MIDPDDLDDATDRPNLTEAARRAQSTLRAITHHRTEDDDPAGYHMTSGNALRSTETPQNGAAPTPDSAEPDLGDHRSPQASERTMTDHDHRPDLHSIARRQADLLWVAPSPNQLWPAVRTGRETT